MWGRTQAKERVREKKVMDVKGQRFGEAMGNKVYLTGIRLNC